MIGFIEYEYWGVKFTSSELARNHVSGDIRIT